MGYLYTVEAKLVEDGVVGGLLTGSPRVSTDAVIRYIVKIYEEDGITRLTGTQPAVSWSVTSSSPSNIVWKDYFKKMGGFATNENSNWISDVAGKGLATVQPVFNVEVDGDTATLKGTFAAPIFTIAPVTKIPTVPSQIKTDLAATEGLSTTSDVYYNPCKEAIDNVWGALIIKRRPVAFDGGTSYEYIYTMNFYKKDGSKGATSLPFGVDSPISYADNQVLRDTSVTSGPNKTAYSKAIQYITDFKNGVYCLSTTKRTGSPGDATQKAFITDARWNPPNHIVTRPDSLGEIIAGDSLVDGDNYTDKDKNTFTRKAKAERGMVDKDSRLGYIFSDKTYKNNVFMSSLGKSPVPEDAEWGFRFTYNPTTISYNTTPMAGMDIQLIEKDPTDMVPGNTTIGVGLLLNRQADMITLDPNNPERSNWKNYYQTDSTRGYLSESQLNFLWTRGTEYDLEFLYRILSAKEPTSRALLKNGDLTSDLGFLTVQPFWVTFHDNMTYFCKINSISVNHVAFTKNMVPYLTEVTLEMTRMLTPELDIQKTINKVYTSGGGGGGTRGAVIL